MSGIFIQIKSVTFLFLHISVASSSSVPLVVKEGNLMKSLSWAGHSNKDPAQGAPPAMRVITRLWCHELYRNFSDRLSTDDGRDDFCIIP